MLLERLQTLQGKVTTAITLLKLDEAKKKIEEFLEQMSAPDFWTVPEKAQKISQTYQNLKDEMDKWIVLDNKIKELVELSSINDESLLEEMEHQTAELEKQYTNYEVFFLLNGRHDENNAIVSINAGSGGTEAQDWAAMLARMILRFAERQGWSTQIIDESLGAEAGYKSITFEVKGRYAYGYLKSEHGVHRLVRISPFDAEKMRHTSFAGIEVLPEVDNEVKVEIDSKDLRIDTFMSGGKGGQSVNTTYSAVRIVHLPTGISVSCQNERSQQQNKETAMKVLKSKLLLLEEQRQAAERTELRGEHKAAEWGSQIRSYVLHPYHLVKDNRSDYESADPEGVLEGNLLPLAEAYLQFLKKD